MIEEKVVKAVKSDEKSNNNQSPAPKNFKSRAFRQNGE